MHCNGMMDKVGGESIQLFRSLVNYSREELLLKRHYLFQPLNVNIFCSVSKWPHGMSRLQSNFRVHAVFTRQRTH